MEAPPEFPMFFGKSDVVDIDGQIVQALTDDANKPLKGGYVFKEIILIKQHQ